VWIAAAIAATAGRCGAARSRSSDHGLYGVER
jgi:hypothetical protein